MSGALISRTLLRPNHNRRWRRRCFSSLKRKEGWESVIGLEVHAQIATESKLFSKSGTKFAAPVNTSVSLFDAAIPGTLPVLNRAAVEAAVLTSMSLSCQLNPVSFFDRKHYFYSDLPTGYQITQQRKAVANNGQLEFVIYNPSVHKTPYYAKSKIRQLQLEMDSGKSLHVPQGNRSLIDLNRAGIALMEIVFDPDLKDGEEAAALVKELTLILEKLGTCSCSMEEGALRVDANISVNRTGESLGTRTEVKNLSSVRSLVNAIEFEVRRQIQLLENGETVVNETRGYDALTKETVPMRDKEERQDYRFMPEPNLPPLRLTYQPGMVCDPNVINIANMRKKLQELPDVARKRLMKTYDLKLDAAIVIVNTPGFLKYFNDAMKNQDAKLGKRTFNFMSGAQLEEVNERNITINECPIEPSKFGEIIKMYDDEIINHIKAKELVQVLWNGDDRSPKQIVDEEGWAQVTDTETIRKTCLDVIQENPKLLAKIQKGGKPKYFHQLVGKVADETEGKYNMKLVSQIMQELTKFDAKTRIK